MSTVADVFTGLGLTQWWKYPTQFFGQNGEMGTDYGMGGTGKPVGSITPGQVIYVDNPYANDPKHSSLGYVVQVLSPDGHVYHYQHLQAPSVHVGDQIAVGSVVGVSGGCPVGCYGSNGQCTCTDDWTTGQHIEVRRALYSKSGGVWGQPWSNPYQTFLQIAGSSPNSVAGPWNGTTNSGTNTTGTTQSGTPTSTTGPNLQGFGVKAGLFIVAFILVIFGAYLVFKKQGDALLHKGLEAAKIGALA